MSAKALKTRPVRTACLENNRPEIGSALGKPAGSKSPYPGSALIQLLMPVPIVPAVQPLRSVQNVELRDGAGLKLGLLYWICRRSDKGRDRGRIKAVIVIRERGGNFHVLIIVKTSK